jgi:hypothetical protein
MKTKEDAISTIESLKMELEYQRKKMYSHKKAKI